MTQLIVTITLWFLAIGTGLMAGLYFSFSTFIMTAFARIDQAHGISAMQSINKVILGSLFMPIFLGTTVAAAALAVFAFFRLGEAGATAMIAAGVIYVVGMFVCTVVLNVPLNNQLAAVDPASAEVASVWTRYLRDWNLWNHVRTVSSTLACALYIAAIAARS